MDKQVQLKNGKKVTLRLIKEEDVEGIWTNFNEVVEEKIYLPVYTPVSSSWEKSQWFSDLSLKNNHCIVAIDKTQKSPKDVVGQCTLENLEWEAAEHVYQLGIIVQGGFRNSGLGYEIINFAIEIAKRAGKKKIILSTFSTNKLGLTLYQKCGFKIVGTYSKQYFVNDTYVDEVIMEKFLVDFAN
jgi:RimJ/RimL family protein N-acetyltransferase